MLFGKTPLKAQNDFFPKNLGAWPIWHLPGYANVHCSGFMQW